MIYQYNIHVWTLYIIIISDQPPHCFLDDDCEKPAICIRPGPPGMHGFCMQISKPNFFRVYRYEPMLIWIKPNKSTIKFLWWILSFCAEHWIPHCIEACKDLGGNEVGCKKSCECYGQCLKDGGTLDSCRPKCQHPEKMKGMLELISLLNYRVIIIWLY